MKIVFICYLFGTLLFATEFETTQTTKISAGVIHKEIRASAIPWDLDVLEIDLTNPDLSFQTVKAADLVWGNERTSAMASRLNRPGHRVLGAVNADFYHAGGIPINAQVADGEVIRTVYHNSKTCLYFDRNNHPHIETLNFSGSIHLSGRQTAVHAVNLKRLTNTSILYNNYFGASTSTNKWGSELLATALDPWVVNDTIRFSVDKLYKNRGDNAIPQGKVVFSAHGTAQNFMDNYISVGDTLKVILKLQPAVNRIVQLTGGYPKIISDGISCIDSSLQKEGRILDFHTKRHPRTAIGFNSARTRLWFVTVDGRQAHSAGMSLYELADFMLSLGADQALNLDGGGSTTMWVDGTIKNSPSDGNERRVANALLLISSVPEGEVSVQGN